MATESPLVRRLLWNLLPLALVVWAVTTTLIGHDGLLERHAVKQALYARRDQVARLAARHITPEGSLRLRQALEAERIPFRDYDERMKRLTDVHLVINDLCGNHLFEAIVNSMIQLTHQIVGAADPADHDQVHGLGEHDKLVAAILAGDEEVAAKAMSEHVISFTDRLVRMDQTYRTMRRVN